MLMFLFAAAVAMFEVISKALPGFFNTLVAILLPGLAELLRKFFNKTTYFFCLYSVTRNVLRCFSIKR